MSNEKNTAVIVERVGNGYQVSPVRGKHEVNNTLDVMVFQDKGFVTAAREQQRVDATLLGWLDAHFGGADQGST